MKLDINILMIGIEGSKQETIEKYLGLLSLDTKGLKRVNSLRKLVGNSVI